MTGIGNWLYILETLSFVSIFTNVGILVFTYNNYYELSEYNKILLYMLLVFFYIVVKLIVASLIPDSTFKDIELQKRHLNIVEKMCDPLPESSDDIPLYRVSTIVYGTK